MLSLAAPLLPLLTVAAVNREGLVADSGGVVDGATAAMAGPMLGMLHVEAAPG